MDLKQTRICNVFPIFTQKNAFHVKMKAEWSYFSLVIITFSLDALAR
jgi:hypothetical protein